GSSVNANPTVTTTYTVTGTSAAGCKDSTSVTITVNANPVISVIPLTPAICPGSSVGLTASGATTYVWTPAGGLTNTTFDTTTASPLTTTTYTVTGTDVNGCVSSQSVTVTINPNPIIT